MPCSIFLFLLNVSDRLVVSRREYSTGLINRVGLELTKAYLGKGWKVIAAVRDPSKMPKIEGDMVVIKLEVGEKEDAKKVCLPRFSTVKVYARL
jgi:hypothetical protein